MPIYKITNSASGNVVAVKANTKAQALNFVTNDLFDIEPMKPEEIVTHMECGDTVKNATINHSAEGV